MTFRRLIHAVPFPIRNGARFTLCRRATSTFDGLDGRSFVGPSYARPVNSGAAHQVTCERCKRMMTTGNWRQ